MFGINDDDKQNEPAGDQPMADDPPVMPKPVSQDDTTAPASGPVINPISGNETLGPPPSTDPMPAISGGASPASMPAPAVQSDAKRKLLTPLPTPVSAAPVAPAPAAEPPVAEPPAGSQDLLDIKKEALQDLVPLVGQLNQPPEEKFKTIMMLIQASDNQDLVKGAYEAANAISDEKAKAQALLDIVNEINYFTQRPSGNDQ